MITVTRHPGLLTRWFWLRQDENKVGDGQSYSYTFGYALTRWGANRAAKRVR